MFTLHIADCLIVVVDLDTGIAVRQSVNDCRLHAAPLAEESTMHALKLGLLGSRKAPGALGFKMLNEPTTALQKLEVLDR